MKKVLSILLSLILMLSVLTIVPVTTAQALDSVEYIDEYGVTYTANSVTPITGDTNALSNGWYAVKENTTISDRIICDSDVYLILCDGATLTVSEGSRSTRTTA